MTTVYRISNADRQQVWLCYWDPKDDVFRQIGNGREVISGRLLKNTEYSIESIEDETEHWESEVNDR